MQRQHWPSRWIFILAAVGSAAGLGNLWRFPFLAYEHGGGAFILVLILANILIGIPILALEIGMGQMTQKSAPDAFDTIKKGWRYLGWFALMVAFMVIAYYMVVMSWSVNYFAAAFTQAWSMGPKEFFFDTTLSLSPGVGELGGIAWSVFAGLIISWILVYFCVWKGVTSVSKVVVWTATLPFIILILLIIRAVTLDGAMAGLELLFIPDWSALKDPQLWIAAFSQVFLSLSVGFGVMLAYGSFNKENAEITKSAIWIALGNFTVSIMSGIVVFGTLGYMALQQGLPINEVVAGGPSLAFIVFPQAISLLPAFNELIAVIFFAMVGMLAIDSAFSILESVAAPFKDRLPKSSTKKITLIISLIGFLAGIIYTTGAGLYYLDIVDHFIINYGVVSIGILEAILIGWIWKGDKLKHFINTHSKLKLNLWWDFSIKIFAPIFLTILLIWNLYNEFQAPYEGYPVWALIYIGAGALVITPIIGVILDKLVPAKETIEV